MDPKILVVLGAGGFMCLLFVIIGIIAWVTSGDDDDDDDDKSSNNNGGGGSGGGSGGGGGGGGGGDDVCGEACLAALVATGVTTVSEALPASDGIKCSLSAETCQTHTQAESIAAAVGMPEAAALSVLCSPGYVAFEGKCYPVCDNYVFEDGQTGTPQDDVRKLFVAKGNSGGNSSCGTTDGGSNKGLGGNATDGTSWYDHIQGHQTAQFGFCNQTFGIDSTPNAATGYVICHAAGGRCRDSYRTASEDYPKIECIPKNVMPGGANTGKKAPECSSQWNYGEKPAGTSGGNTWKEASSEGGCLCYDGTDTSTELYIHNGDGNDWALNTWRCKSNRADTTE